ncbi:MAG: ABC transporter permease [Actinomycetota bacterium]
MGARGGVKGISKSPIPLRLFAWGFFLWFYVPILIAIRVSVTEGEFSFDPHGFTLEWFKVAFQEEDLRDGIIHSLVLAVATVAIALPLGTAMALGLRHMRSRAATALKGMVFLAIGLPQLALAVALFILFASVFTFVKFGGIAQLLAHVTLAIPFVVVIVLVRLQTIAVEYEEMAQDLGASPAQAVRRVILPLTAPAMAIASAVAFVVSYDNIVLSQQLCIERFCRTIPVMLYGGGRSGSPSPGPYALGVIALTISLLVISLSWAAYRAVRARTQI